MRYSASHKEQTRQRLIESSGTIAKCGGFATTGVDSLMKAIGLTGGAFYSHVPSKSDLFTEVVRRELSRSPMIVRGGLLDRTRLKRCLNAYLSLAHLHDPEAGCAIPALGAEIARANLEVRQEAEHWICLLHDVWATALGDAQLAWALIAQCVGALVIARMLASEESQREVLAASLDHLHSQLASTGNEVGG